MATLTSSYQYLGRSSVMTSVGGTLSYYILLYGKTSANQTSGIHTVTIKEVLASVNTGATFYYYNTTFSGTVAGKTAFSGTNEPKDDWELGSFTEGGVTYRTGTVIGEGSATVDATDGTAKNVTLACSWKMNDVADSYTPANGTSRTVSVTATLAAIQRGVNITSLELNDLTETSIVVKWATNEPRGSTYYTFDNGTNWIGSATHGETLASDGKSGSFNIKGLTPNTKYNLKVRFKKTGNDLWTESNTISFTTYDYPHCTSSPDFTIGDALTLDFYNPLSRNITIIGRSLANESEIFTGSTNGTRLVGFNDANSVNKQYISIPNSQSSVYAVLVYFGDIVRMRNSNNVYRVRGNEIPTINEFSYFDGNKNITDNITYNAAEIVQNLSDLNVFFYGATPNYGAGSIKKYVVTCNGKTKEFGASGTYSLGTVDSTNNVPLTFTAIDSRGLSASKTFNVNVLAHSSPNATVTLQRLNNYEDETYLTVDGSVSSVNGKNTMKIEYRYKISGGSYGSFVTIGDNAKQTLSLNKNNAYIFNIVVTDAFGSKFDKEYPLGKGVFPLFIDTVKNSVGINCFPKGVGTLEINEIDVLMSSMPYKNSTTADANSVTTQGIYVIPEASVNNYPEWNGNGLLIVFSTTAGIFYQMFIKYEGSAWGRISWFGNWSSWLKLSN